MSEEDNELEEDGDNLDLDEDLENEEDVDES